MLEITCRGTAYEIGLKHGTEAKCLIQENVTFYSQFFQSWSKISWGEATTVAQGFLPHLEMHVPHLVEEMKGIADGCGLGFMDILALNARSEIAMGMLSDGCTALAWKTDNFCIAGQNWDMEMTAGQIAHTNHFLAQHCFPPPAKLRWPDTIPRLERVTYLLQKCKAELTDATDGMRCVENILDDEDGFPVAINRYTADADGSATLFSIVTDLKKKTARLRFGRPSAPEGIWTLNPAALL
ncbi:hypothetical protein NLG97_g1047 [Lecanicillium saksenae]|uniref:Uncharacterized protein n=1 Tax=Lecanicillium saksenae TaxID=468837 RepID=A0ACC1R7H6_9HYPO|nr:hypothetical protein NLG97_g1047 [Lecanicillium saksenae]